MPVRSTTKPTLAAAIERAQQALADAARSVLGVQPQPRLVPVRVHDRRTPARPARGARW